MNTLLNKDSKYSVYDWTNKTYDLIVPSTNLNDAEYHSNYKANNGGYFYLMLGH
jgi:hypothetical protein